MDCDRRAPDEVQLDDLAFVRLNPDVADVLLGMGQVTSAMSVTWRA